MADDNLIFLMAGGSVFLGLAVALILVRQGTRAARFLAAVLAVAVLNILHGLLWTPAQGPSSGLLTEPLQFALPPLFAAYVRALMDSGWRPRWRDLLHFLPLVIMSILSLILTMRPPAPDFPALAWSVGGWGLLLIQAFFYIGRAIRRIKAFRRALNDEVSTLRGIDQTWLLWYSRALHLLYLAYAAVPFVLLHAGGTGPAGHLIGTALCAAVVILALHQLMTRPTPALEMPAGEPRPSQTAAPAWDPALPDALRAAMNERRLFTDPELSLGSLAQRLGWPRNEVSAAINGHFRQNFHDFINGFRVMEAQRLMLDPAKRHLTLVALALEAGFNSKPTFNAAFKKTTGLTPSAWLRQQTGR